MSCKIEVKTNRISTARIKLKSAVPVDRIRIRPELFSLDEGSTSSSLLSESLMTTVLHPRGVHDETIIDVAINGDILMISPSDEEITLLQNAFDESSACSVAFQVFVDDQAVDFSVISSLSVLIESFEPSWIED